MYRGHLVGRHRLDMVVEGSLVLEAKATEVFPPSAKRQLYGYLRGARLPLGLVLHFGPEPRVYRVYCDQVKDQNPRPLERREGSDMI